MVIPKQLVGALGALILSAGAAAHDLPRPKLLTVGGEGEVRVAPDRADVRFAVEASERTLADAEQKVTDGVTKLLKLCDSLQIPKSNVRSAQLIVQPQYDYGKTSSRPRIVGYQVSRQLEVDLRDLSKLGLLLQGAVETGANQMGGIAFGSTRKDEHQRAALALAAEDARGNAQQLARTLGVKLGNLHSLSANESGGAPPPMPHEGFNLRAATMMDKAAAQTYQVGEMVFTATVTANFDLP